MRRQALAAVLGLLVLSACGGTAGAAARAPTAGPTGTPPPPSAAPTPSPSPTPAPPAATFSATVTRAPGALVRFGPGPDMPAMDVDPAGRVDVLDGWSGDWFHLADGRGWVSSSSVGVLPPAGLPPAAWARPATLPAPAAGLLDIALDLQDRRATCEVAALKMALAGRGIATDETTLLGYTGIDGRPPVVDATGAILRWGDPDAAFVGSPDSNPPDHTGYGVYAAPIARAAERSGATVSASGTGIGPADLYAAVVGGHPAVAWVTNDYQPAALASWQAWDGARVRYSLKEHAVVVIGVTPTMVLLDDPWFGQRWHSRSEFEGAYGTFGDMAVILA